ncbi:MAG: MFS transporter [Spirochaetaceae bacterium]|nr:MAG: MFS transporter [Spirochaetaceae bacterium]
MVARLQSVEHSMKLYQGWKVAIAGMGINFLVGISYAWSIYARGLSRELGWSQAETALPYTVFIVCYAVSMVAAGRAQDRLGPRPVVTVGALLVGSAFLVSAFMVRPLPMALVWGGLFGTGLAACFGSVTPAAMKWFPPRSRGLVAGVVVTGVGLSAIVMSPLVHVLVQQSVTTAFVVSGLMLLIGTLLLSRWVSNPPQLDQQQPHGSPEVPWYRVLRDHRFGLLWLMFLLSTTSGLTFATHLDRIARVQASLHEGFLTVSLFALFNAIGRPLGGIVSDRIGRTRSMTLTFAFMTLMLLLSLVAYNAVLLSLAVAMIGLGYGTIFSLFPAATVTFFGEKRFGLYYGLVFTAIGGAGIYPLLAGHLFDRLGNFTLALGLPALFCAIAALLSLRLSRLNPQ